VRNVERARDDVKSILNLYRELIALRRREAALSIGSYQHIAREGDLFAFQRSESGRRFLIVLNFGPHDAVFESDQHTFRGEIAINTRLDRSGEHVEGPIQIRGDEAVIVELS
jgi:alpha-glucosidase